MHEQRLFCVLNYLFVVFRPYCLLFFFTIASPICFSSIPFINARIRARNDCITCIVLSSCPFLLTVNDEISNKILLDYSASVVSSKIEEDSAGIQQQQNRENSNRNISVVEFAKNLILHWPNKINLESQKEIDESMFWSNINTLFTFSKHMSFVLYHLRIPFGLSTVVEYIKSQISSDVILLIS